MDSLLVEPETTSRTQRRRSRKRRKIAGRALIFALAGGVGVAGVAYVASRKPVAKAPVIGADADGEQLTTLIAMTLSDDPSQQADSLMLFGVERTGDEPLALFIPVGTFAQIPGQGFESIGKALTFGRPSLLETTVENLLGIGVDRTVVLDDVTVGTVVDAIGGIDVDVPEELYDTDDKGRRVLAVSRGQHHFDGASAVAYMTTRAEGVTELTRFVRMQAVWQGILAAAGPNGSVLAQAIRSLDEDSLTAGEKEPLAALLAVFARRAPLFEVLPAEDIGSGGDEAYKVDEAQVAQLVQRDFAGSVAAGVIPGARPRLEIRNGNGRPESGERVAALLVPAGMNIVVTGNARSFAFASTRVVVYGDDEASLTLGRKIRDLLGVGEVEVGTRGQTVVDVTVVVGRDFLQRKG